MATRPFPVLPVLGGLAALVGLGMLADYLSRPSPGDPSPDATLALPRADERYVLTAKPPPDNAEAVFCARPVTDAEYAALVNSSAATARGLGALTPKALLDALGNTEAMLSETRREMAVCGKPDLARVALIHARLGTAIRTELARRQMLAPPFPS